MKKVLTIVIVSLFFSATANSFFQSKKPSLFGIELGSNISNYIQRKCLEDHNYSQLKSNNFLDLAKSTEARTGPTWTNWSYNDTKLPVSEGCIMPEVDNKDFFNFKVKIYPKTKEIYKISALYRRVYNYAYDELAPKEFFLQLDSKGNPTERKTGVVNIEGTQCDARAYELAKIIIKSHKKKNFRFDELKKHYTEYWRTVGYKGSSRKSKLIIEVGCTIEGSGSNYINFDSKFSKVEIRNFLIDIMIKQEDGGRYNLEVDMLKEEIRGNLNKNLNKDGL